MKNPGVICTACAAINCSIVRGKHSACFFQFPRDEARCMLWVVKCRRLDLFAFHPHVISVKYALCEKHFSPDDLEYGGTRLKSNAVPTLFDFPVVKYTTTLLPSSGSSDSSNNEAGELPQGIKFNSVNRVVVYPEGKIFICGGPLLAPQHLQWCSDVKRLLYVERRVDQQDAIPPRASIFIGVVQLVKKYSGRIRSYELFNISCAYVTPNWLHHSSLKKHLSADNELLPDICEVMKFVYKDKIPDSISLEYQKCDHVNEIENELLTFNKTPILSCQPKETPNMFFAVVPVAPPLPMLTRTINRTIPNILRQRKKNDADQVLVYESRVDSNPGLSSVDLKPVLLPTNRVQSSESSRPFVSSENEPVHQSSLNEKSVQSSPKIVLKQKKMSDSVLSSKIVKGLETSAHSLKNSSKKVTDVAEYSIYDGSTNSEVATVHIKSSGESMIKVGASDYVVANNEIQKDDVLKTKPSSAGRMADQSTAILHTESIEPSMKNSKDSNNADSIDAAVDDLSTATKSTSSSLAPWVLPGREIVETILDPKTNKKITQITIVPEMLVGYDPKGDKNEAEEKDVISNVSQIHYPNESSASCSFQQIIVGNGTEITEALPQVNKETDVKSQAAYGDDKQQSVNIEVISTGCDEFHLNETNDDNSNCSDGISNPDENESVAIETDEAPKTTDSRYKRILTTEGIITVDTLATSIVDNANEDKNNDAPSESTNQVNKPAIPFSSLIKEIRKAPLTDSMKTKMKHALIKKQKFLNQTMFATRKLIKIPIKNPSQVSADYITGVLSNVLSISSKNSSTFTITSMDEPTVVPKKPPIKTYRPKKPALGRKRIPKQKMSNSKFHVTKSFSDHNYSTASCEANEKNDDTSTDNLNCDAVNSVEIVIDENSTTIITESESQPPYEQTLNVPSAEQNSQTNVSDSIAKTGNSLAVIGVNSASKETVSTRSDPCCKRCDDAVITSEDFVPKYIRCIVNNIAPMKKVLIFREKITPDTTSIRSPFNYAPSEVVIGSGLSVKLSKFSGAFKNYFPDKMKESLGGINSNVEDIMLLKEVRHDKVSEVVDRSESGPIDTDVTSSKQLIETDCSSDVIDEDNDNQVSNDNEENINSNNNPENINSNDDQENINPNNNEENINLNKDEYNNISNRLSTTLEDLRMKEISLQDKNLPDPLKKLIQNVSPNGVKIMLVKDPSLLTKKTECGGVLLSNEVKQLIKTAAPNSGKVLIFKGKDLKDESSLQNLSKIIHNSHSKSNDTLRNKWGYSDDLEVCNEFDNRFSTLPPGMKKSSFIPINAVDGQKFCYCGGEPVPTLKSINAATAKSIPDGYKHLAEETFAMRKEIRALRKSVKRYKDCIVKVKARPPKVKLEHVLQELKKRLKSEAYEIVSATLLNTKKKLRGSRYNDELKKICCNIALCGGWAPYKYLSSFFSFPQCRSLHVFIRDQLVEGHSSGNMNIGEQPSTNDGTHVDEIINKVCVESVLGNIHPKKRSFVPHKKWRDREIKGADDMSESQKNNVKKIKLFHYNIAPFSVRTQQLKPSSANTSEKSQKKQAKATEASVSPKSVKTVSGKSPKGKSPCGKDGRKSSQSFRTDLALSPKKGSPIVLNKAGRFETLTEDSVEELRRRALMDMFGPSTSNNRGNNVEAQFEEAARLEDEEYDYSYDGSDIDDDFEEDDNEVDGHATFDHNYPSSANVSPAKSVDSNSSNQSNSSMCYNYNLEIVGSHVEL